MEMSGQVYSPVRLRRANGPSVTAEKESGRVLEPVWLCWRIEKYMAPAGIQTRIYSAVKARSQVSVSGNGSNTDRYNILGLK
jgi:hypothetical protein